MDISRPELKQKKRRRTLLLSSLLSLAVVAALVYTLGLKPAIPTVDTPVFTDTVKRGELLRQVRAPGTLVPVGMLMV